MLNKASSRLKQFSKIIYLNYSFQDFIKDYKVEQGFDFIFSSFAIHHLTKNQKNELYQKVFENLNQGGCFLNYDVVRPCSSYVESWYLREWEDWILKNNITHLAHIPKQYKDNKDNIPTSLEEQLFMLKDTGFKDIDCHFKYGIFALFGGIKINRN